MILISYADGKMRYNITNPNSWQAIAVSLRAGLVTMASIAPIWTIKTRLACHRDY